MVKAAKRRSVSSVSVRSGRETGKTKVVAAVVGAHGARDGRAVERAEGAAGAEGRRAEFLTNIEQTFVSVNAVQTQSRIFGELLVRLSSDRADAVRCRLCASARWLVSVRAWRFRGPCLREHALVCALDGRAHAAHGWQLEDEFAPS